MGYHVGSSSSHRRWFQRLSASLLNCLACLTVWLACPSCLLVVVPALWSFQRPSRPRASATGASATGASAVKASAGPFASALGSALAVAFVLPPYCLEISVLVSPQVNPVARKATSGGRRRPGVKGSGRRGLWEDPGRAEVQCEQKSSASKSGRRPPASLLPAQGGQCFVPPRLVLTEEPCAPERTTCIARKCASEKMCYVL